VVPSSAQAQDFQRYETQYYILVTDVPREQAQEASLRMTKMAEEYHTRTRDFSGAIRQKFPFHLYRHREDYLADGGKPGTSGLFNGTELRAVGGERLDDRTWHTVQHEGFHQFAAAVIGGERPTWVNEGLAEYFGEALFTGNGYISGIIPDWRYKRIKEEIREGKFLPFEKMMTMSLEEWNARVAIVNYDQAWSMTHFLAHGDNGKYQKAFAAFMIDLSKGKPPTNAWRDNFGPADGFEERWRKWWLNLPDDPTADLYAQATVARLTAFLGRAAAQKQIYASWSDFHDAAASGEIKTLASDWLPSSLLANAIAEADDLAKNGAQWTLSPTAPQLRCILKNGTRVSGTFQLRGAQVTRADAKVEGKK